MIETDIPSGGPAAGHGAEITAGESRERSLPDSHLERKHQEIQANLDRLLANLPKDPSEAQALAVKVLGLMPPAKLLGALQLIVNEGTAPPIRTELARKLVLLRLLVDAELRNLNGSSCIELQSLHLMSLSITALIERISSLRQEFGWQTLQLNQHDQLKLDKLQRELMPATDRLNSYSVLLSMLEPLARAAAAGRIGEIPYLKSNEAAMFMAALSPENEKGASGRVVIDAAALRCRIQQDLEAWEQLLEAEPDESADTEAGEPAARAALPEQPANEDELAVVDDRKAAAASHRRDMLERLRLDMSVYNILLERLQYQQTVTIAAGDKVAADAIYTTQRALFPVFSKLAAAVRNPTRQSKKKDDEAATARERMFQDAEEAEKNARPSETKEEIYLEALTEMRDAKKAKPAVLVPVSDKKHERRRRTILLGIAGVLAVVAGAVNLALWDFTSAPLDLALDQFSPAVPLHVAVPIGPAMYAEIRSFNWSVMGAEERSSRIALLGQLAQDRGFDAVYLVDENKTELARWTRGGGVKFAPGGIDDHLERSTPGGH